MNIDLTAAEMARCAQLLMAASNLTDPVDGAAHYKLMQALKNFKPPEERELQGPVEASQQWRSPI